MEQEITYYSHGKLHVGQITVRESARSTKKLFEIGAPLHVEPITRYFYLCNHCLSPLML
jgi:hypothetical protein